MSEPAALPTARQEVLALFAGNPPSRLPCFSGLISVTVAGLAQEQISFAAAHQDAGKMARAAASSYRLSGFQSAVVPLDLCVEAEALGTEVDFLQEALEPAFPLARKPAAESVAALALPAPDQFLRLGRLPLVQQALRLLRADVGLEVALGAMVPGPFTLAMYLLPPEALLLEVGRHPAEVRPLLERLADLLAAVAQAYRAAGADFITVHEMGGSPGYLGPRLFERVVLPPLQRLLAGMPAPRVLSVCGRVNRALPLLAQAGADALSLDQLADLALARQHLRPGQLLFGNIDPVETLANGDEAAVRQAVAQAAAAGVDAIWPGCDLWPAVPPANLQALVAAAALP